MHAGRRGSAIYMQDHVKVTMWHLIDSKLPSEHNRIDGCDERATYVFVIKGTDCWPPKQGQQVKVIYSMGLSIFALTLCSAVLHLTSILPGTHKVYAVCYCYSYLPSKGLSLHASVPFLVSSLVYGIIMTHIDFANVPYMSILIAV